jgi:hypothetical protein
MTRDEAIQRINGISFERSAILTKIAIAARAAVSVLLDDDRVHSAKALQELLFELDVNDAEAMAEFVKANPMQAVAALTARLERQGSD